MRVAQRRACRGGVVEEGLHAVAHGCLGGHQVVVDAGPLREVDARTAGEESGEPLDEVADDVAGGPLGDRDCRFQVASSGTASTSAVNRPATSRYSSAAV